MKELKISLVVYDERGIEVNVGVPVFDSGIYLFGTVKDNKAYNTGKPLSVWDSIADGTMIFGNFKAEFIPIVFYENSSRDKYYLLVSFRGVLARVSAFPKDTNRIEVTGNIKNNYINP